MRLLGDSNIPELPGTSLTRPKSEDLAQDRRNKLRIRMLIVVDLLVSTLLLYVSIVYRSEADWLNEGVSSIGLLLGLAGILGALVYGMTQTLLHELALLDQDGLRHAIRTRDRRGRRIPSMQERLCLIEQEDLTEQPPAFLLATIASGNKADHDLQNRCTKALIGDIALAPAPIPNFPAYPAATTLTKVDFVRSDNPQWRIQALAEVSPDLWYRATEDLLGASYPEARLAGIKSLLASKRRLMQLCCDDEDARVREAAWKRVEALLSPRDVMYVLQSSHADVRCTAVQSGILRRNLLLRLAKQDTDLSVRQQAWMKVQANLTSQECGVLCTSEFTDVRTAIAAHGETSPNLLFKLARDRDENVRVIALPRSLMNATPFQYYRLSLYSYDDVRMGLARDPRIPPRIFNRLRQDSSIKVRSEVLVRGLQDSSAEDLAVLATDKRDAYRAAVAKHPLASKALLQILSNDADDYVRNAASQRMLEDATEEDLAVLSTNKDAHVRAAVTKHPLIYNALLHILSNDADSDVRKLASQRVLEDATEEDLAVLSTNKDAQVRAAVAGNPFASKAQLRILSNDTDSKVRKLATQCLLEDATEGDLTLLSTNKDADVRVTVARHQSTTETVLFNLATDSNPTVREGALPRVLPKLSYRQYEALYQSQQIDVLLAIANFPQTPREILLTLACDRNVTIRRQALPRILPDLSFPEMANLLKAPSQYSDVQNPVLEALTKRLGQPGAEVVLPHLRDNSRQREVVKSILDLEGDSALAKIQRTIGNNETLRLVSSSRIIAFFHAQSPSRVADFLSDIGKLTSSYRIGTTAEEIEDTNYDPYGYSSSTTTYTHYEDTLISISHYEKSLVKIVIECLEAMESSKSTTVVGLLHNQNFELARLIRAGLEKRDWIAEIHREVLERAHAHTESNFTRSSDDDIIRQIR